MNVLAILFLVGLMSLVGAVLFFIVRIFYRKEIEKSPNAEKWSYTICAAVLAYFALLFIFSFNGYESIAKLMLIAAAIFGFVGAFLIGKNHD